MPKVKCKHNWKAFNYCGNNVGFRCSTCEEMKSRPMNKAEKYMLKRQEQAAAADPIHKIYHDFLKKCGDSKLRGYDLMKLVEKWAKKFPTVDIVSCDDDYHMGSYLVVIPHENTSEYWGTTIVFIPQNGKDPSTFFLYPGHAKEFLKVIQKTVNITKNNNIFNRFNQEKPE